MSVVVRDMDPIDRRRFLALLALPALASLVPLACGDDDPEGSSDGGGGTDGGGEVRADRVRLATQVGDVEPAVSSLNTLGFDLYATLAPGSEGNLVFSPASIAIALAMTSAGAAGDTATAFASVLGSDDAVALHRGFNALDVAVAARNGTFRNASDEPGEVTLRIANSLWGQDGLAFEAAFLELLAGEYGAGMRIVDYEADPEAARVLVNAWVADATEDRIPELIAPGVFSQATRLALVNAIYLKAAWMQAFAAEATTAGNFTTFAGATVEVPFMKSSGDLPHAAGEGWQATELAFIGGELAMTLLVPDAGRLDDVEAMLDTALFDEVVASLAPTTVNLSMPKFDIETATSLADVLTELGLAAAFDPDAADFSAMTTVEQLFVSDVIHQANITVDEQGAEAAAATAVVMDTTSAPVEIVELHLDRPFLFALRDTTTAAVLFLGRVGDPSV